MMRIRHANGTTEKVEANSTVEVLDRDGLVGMVILQRGKDTLHVLMPGDPLFVGYCKSNGLMAARVHTHQDPLSEIPAGV